MASHYPRTACSPISHPEHPQTWPGRKEAVETCGSSVRLDASKSWGSQHQIRLLPMQDSSVGFQTWPACACWQNIPPAPLFTTDAPVLYHSGPTMWVCVGLTAIIGLDEPHLLFVLTTEPRDHCPLHFWKSSGGNDERNECHCWQQDGWASAVVLLQGLLQPSTHVNASDCELRSFTTAGCFSWQLMLAHSFAFSGAASVTSLLTGLSCLQFELVETIICLMGEVSSPR